jgi:hypothetical protein
MLLKDPNFASSVGSGRDTGRSHWAHPVFARGSLMVLHRRNRIVCLDANAFIPALERGNPFVAIHVASAGLNARDFLLSNDFEFGRRAEQRLRRLPFSDVAENR